MITAAISHTATQTRVAAGMCTPRLTMPYSNTEDAEDGQDDPPDAHQSTSIWATHLVLRSSGRFGATRRNG